MARGAASLLQVMAPDGACLLPWMGLVEAGLLPQLQVMTLFREVRTMGSLIGTLFTF